MTEVKLKQNSPYDFRGQTALITGSSSGIGRSAATNFAAWGARVILASRNREANEELLQEIQSSGGEGIFIPTDFSNTYEIEQLFTHIGNTYRELNIAINNAGIEGDPGIKTADYGINTWNKVLQINLTAVFHCMQHELRMMIPAKNGAIINVSSLAGLKGGHAGAAYHASKFGLIGLTKAAAIEYAKEGIRINAVCPAVIETPMADRAFNDEDRRKAAIQMHPVGRFGTSQEVVNSMAWLASSQSTFVTGTAIPIDGGASI